MNRTALGFFFTLLFFVSCCALWFGTAQAQVRGNAPSSGSEHTQVQQRTPPVAPQPNAPATQNSQALPLKPETDRREELTRQLERRRFELQRKQLLREQRNDLLRKQRVSGHSN